MQNNFLTCKNQIYYFRVKQMLISICPHFIRFSGKAFKAESIQKHLLGVFYYITRCPIQLDKLVSN